MTYSDYVQFLVQCHQPVFQKKQLLYLRWQLASLLWYLTEDSNLLGQFDRNVGLRTKLAMLKVSENVVKDESLSQTLVDMTNTKHLLSAVSTKTVEG